LIVNEVWLTHLGKGSQPVKLKRKEGWEGAKNAGLKMVTLIAILNPVSQVLW
jgi:hypothetical protein